MCGIAGVMDCSRTGLKTDRLKPMVDAIQHRGPDDAGYFVGTTEGSPPGQTQALSDLEFSRIMPKLTPIDSRRGDIILGEKKWQLFLGHRRLSIIDLTAAGHQPMADEHNQVWIVYNGEIYNFPELRSQLEAKGYRFSSRTDTEVIINSYREWGIDCVERFNGMFAFALWDARSRKLYFARDRYGIKPLYLRRTGHGVVFGSEIKSILAYTGNRPKVDLLALNEYFSFQNTFSRRTLFGGIELMPAATWIEVDADTCAWNEKKYWDFQFTGDSSTPLKSLREELYGLIGQAVKRQCISDVPIGSYLSGGMDSGAITALACRTLGRIRTFTGGFDLSEALAHEQNFDERAMAERMASLFQSEHYECVMHAGDIEAVMDELVWHLEDLRVGQSYPNYYMSRLAGKFVKVVLSGAGGDELFGGYPWRYAAAIGASHGDFIQNYYKYWKRLVSNRDKLQFFNDDTIEQLRELNEGGTKPFVDHTLSMFNRVFDRQVQANGLSDQINLSLYFECRTFLHGLLVVEDKLSMAHSLETRLPLLDNDLVDFACRVPVSYKVSGMDHLELLDENLLHKKELYRDKMQTGKNILRDAMERILPPEITKARKQGFSAPDESWFRGRSESYVRNTLLDSDSLLREYLNPDFIKRVLDLHSAGQENRRLLIWSLLSFECWLRRFANP